MATVISRGNPEPQNMRIVRSGLLTFTKQASTQVNWGSIAHNLGYVPIIDCYMSFTLSGQPPYPGWIVLPYIQSTGGGSDVGRQNFRVNALVTDKRLGVAAITDPLATDTTYYTTSIEINVAYYIWSRPMELPTQ